MSAACGLKSCDCPDITPVLDAQDTLYSALLDLRYRTKYLHGVDVTLLDTALERIREHLKIAED